MKSSNQSKSSAPIAPNRGSININKGLSRLSIVSSGGLPSLNTSTPNSSSTSYLSSPSLSASSISPPSYNTYQSAVSSSVLVSTSTPSTSSSLRRIGDKRSTISQTSGGLSANSTTQQAPRRRGVDRNYSLSDQANFPPSSKPLMTSSRAASSTSSSTSTSSSSSALLTAAPTPVLSSSATKFSRRRLSVMNGAGDSTSDAHLDGVGEKGESKKETIKSVRSLDHKSDRTFMLPVTTSTVTPAVAPAPTSTSTSSLSLSSLTNTLSTSVSPSIKPKRAFSHYSSLSKAGFIPFNPHKVNQDRAVECIRFCGKDDQALFGVFDGHGALGHEVSSFLITELPRQLTNLKHPSPPGDTNISAIQKAFLDTNSKLVGTSVDCSFSGSTGIVVWLQGKRLLCMNVGDSRAVLGKIDSSSNSNKIHSFSLSTDQKPDRTDEKKRIIEHRGRVEACKGMKGEDIGPARVWLQNQDVPGLAMTRSFGDVIAASVGVIAKPEVLIHDIDECNDKFIVLGSDGVFEFLSNEEVCDIVWRIGGPTGAKSEQAVRALVDESVKRWNREEEVVDDITAIIVYL